MAKSRKNQTDYTKSLLIGASVLLAGVSLILGIALYRADNAASGNETTPINVSLGPLEYSVQNGTAVERDDPTINSLREFLNQESQTSLSLGCETVYHNVTAYNKAETQVLLNYGCGYPNANMFAVRDGDDGWRTISPTNQFDTFGIPKCEHVEANGIDKEIAPVCVDGWGQTAEEVQYKAR